MRETFAWLLHTGSGSAVLIGSCILGFMLLCFGMFGKRSEEAVEMDARKDAIALLDIPFQVPGGQWMKYKCTPTPCNEPIKQGEVIIGSGTEKRV